MNAPPTGSQHGKSRCPPRSHSHSHYPGRGGKTNAIDEGEDHSPQDEIVLYGIEANVTTVATPHATFNTKEAPTYDELFIDAINYGTVGDTHPEEIIVDNIHAPQYNEAYTTVQLPSSASRKGTSSICVKVNTGAGGNVLPLCVFKHLYPNQISPAGLPTGLDHVNTRLTAYNRSHIPYRLVARPPWCSTPQGRLILVCCRHPQSCHPRSPIMQKAVIKMNCAITVAQPYTKTPSPTPAPIVMAAKSIRSTDDLMKEFPDWFTGIGRFPGKYTI